MNMNSVIKCNKVQAVNLWQLYRGGAHATSEWTNGRGRNTTKKQSRHSANALLDTKQRDTQSASVKFSRNAPGCKKSWQLRTCAQQRMLCVSTG